MSQKKSGWGAMAMLAGLAAGLAAVFFSKEENREMVAKEAKKAEVAVKKEVVMLEKKAMATEKKAVSKARKAVKKAKSKAKKRR